MAINIQYSVWKKETGDAGGKAKNDAFDIASDFGFTPSYHPSGRRYIRILQQYLSMRKFDSAEAVFLQYPAVDYRVLRSFFKHAGPNKITIVLVHDLRSIQGDEEKKNRNEEISILNHFSYIISHNRFMEAFLKKNGCTSKILNLELFDYLHDIDKEIQEPKGDGSVAFAGNLTKSRFVGELSNIKNKTFLLYGVKGEQDYSNNDNLIYKGCLPSEEIVYRLEGDYGLVWDGDSIETCSGIKGEYLKYNNPHKLSLYIAAGKPVITWKQAAIAEFVERERIGITINSLKELADMDLKNNYKTFRENTIKIKRKIGNGEYLTQALQSCFKGNR